MKKAFIILFICLFSVMHAQSDNQNDKDKKAILETAMNYMEGAYTADAERMQKALWPELNKILPYTIPKTGKMALTSNCYSQLIEVVRGMKDRVNDSDKKIDVRIEIINNGMASVKLTSTLYNDFLHMANIDGQWKIINVLWTFGADSPQRDKSIIFDAEKEKDAIAAAAMDYIDGFFSGDAERMERGIHPEINKVTVNTNPKTGKSFFSKMGSGMLIELTAAKVGLRDQDKRDIKVNILDVMDGLASVEVTSATLYDYLQLAKINGNWKIVNVLWKPRPGASR